MILRLLVLLLLLNFGAGTPSQTAEPEFMEPLQNLTVTAGRDAKLVCAVKHLGSYKVAWIHLERSAILTVQTHIITRNPRISVSSDQHKAWTLLISDVQDSDQGGYMCQINTAVAKSQVGYLTVQVPPTIDDETSSSDQTVLEGSAVNLTCNAAGSSPLSLRWRREDGKAISINKTTTVSEWEGASLLLTRVTRNDMAAYLCIASNGVPPTVSKRILITTEFCPEIWVPHQLAGAPLLSSITLECFVESHPAALHYWDRVDGVVLPEPKYRSESSTIPFGATIPYKMHLRLTIYNITTKDYGAYRCLAKNHYGQAEGILKLYPTVSPTASTTSFYEEAEVTKDVITTTADAFTSSTSSTGKPIAEIRRKPENSIQFTETNKEGTVNTSVKSTDNEWSFTWKASSSTSCGSRTSLLFLHWFLAFSGLAFAQ